MIGSTRQNPDATLRGCNSRIHSSFITQHSAFSLVELLVVIALIVLLLGLAVPALNLISGNRSVDGAVNNLSAMLTTVRAEAIARQSHEGILFFLDSRTGRTSLIPVQFPRYSPWRVGTNYKRGQYLEYPVNVTVSGTVVTFRYWVCKSDHVSTTSGADGPPTAAQSFNTTGGSRWFVGGDWFIDSVEGRESLELPRGIAAQTSYSDQASFGATGAPSYDRYVRQCGLLMFDAGGTLVSTAYGIHPWSALGQRIGLFNVAGLPTFNPTRTPPLPANASVNLLNKPAYLASYRSQFGVVLYDLETIRNQVSTYTERDWITITGLAGVTGGGAGQPTGRIADLDGITPGPGLADNTQESVSDPNATAAARSEEDWLDKNATPLLINRYNGTIVKGE